MPLNDVLTLVLFFGALALVTPLLGRYIARVFSDEPTFLTPLIKPLERWLFALAGVDPLREQTGRSYLGSLIVAHIVGIGVLTLFLATRVLGLDAPEGTSLVSLTILESLNLAVSLVTNTDWLFRVDLPWDPWTYALAFGIPHFLSAAAGLAVAMVLIRGLTRSRAGTVGTFAVDMTRGVLYVLLPLALVAALVLAALGVPQSLDGPLTVTTLEGAHQTLPLGPWASGVAIKLLGSNGGGALAAGSAHPFENPSALSNLWEAFLLLVIGAALTNTLGRKAGRRTEGWALFAAMLVLALLAVGGLYAALSGTSLNGQEVRLGLFGSALFSALGTASSGGALTVAPEDLSALGHLVTLLGMQTGEVVFGGVGSGLYGLVLFVILALFLAGLMVGRTPSYLGKKIEVRDVQWTIGAVLILPVCALIGTAIALHLGLFPEGASTSAAQGFTHVLYTLTSTAANNGSGFATLPSGGEGALALTAFVMLLGRLGAFAAVVALASNLAAKKPAPPSLGTLPTTTPLFVGFVVLIVLTLGGLTFFPALTLGPLAERTALSASVISVPALSPANVRP